MSWLNLEINASENFINGSYTFRLKKVGQEYCSINKQTEIRKRDYYSLHFIMFGSGILKVNDKPYVLSSGCAFLLYEGEQYEYYPSRTDPWSYIWVDLQGEYIDKFFEQAGFSREKPYVKIVKQNEMIGLLKDLHESYSGGKLSDLTCYGYFLMILDRLLKNYEAVNTSRDRHLLRFKQVREMLIYMNNNFRLDLVPSEMADLFNVSLRTFIRTFTNEVGMAPMEYLAAFRIATACELLVNHGELLMEEVANSVGYADQGYFSRVFKKIKGMTPTEYALNYDGEDPFAWLKEKNIDFR